MDIIYLAIAFFTGVIITSAAAGFLSRSRMSQLRKEILADSQLNEERLRGEYEKEVSLHEQTKVRLSGVEGRLDEALKRLENLQIEYASLTERSAAQETYHKEQLALLKDARAELTKDFENISNQIFHTTSERLKNQNRESMDQVLDPLKTQISDFKERVEKVYDSESKDRRTLYDEITNLKELNKRINDEAANLTKALKGDSQKQGAWGEVVLERLLEESGLRKGYEYETQVSYTDTEGRRKRPDVILHLPDEKDIILDSKVSLVAYEQYSSEPDEKAKDRWLKDHVASVRAHIKELVEKDYDELEQIRTLDYVLMFIPIESAFMTAIEGDKRLFSDAYEKNIIIVSPSTLMVTLRTIQNIWRYERQNANAQEIAEKAGKLYDKFALFIEALQEVERHLGNSQGALSKAFDRLARGRGNLVNQAQQIQALGAKTKKQISKELTIRSEEEA